MYIPLAYVFIKKIASASERLAPIYGFYIGIQQGVFFCMLHVYIFMMVE